MAEPSEGQVTIGKALEAVADLTQEEAAATIGGGIQQRRISEYRKCLKRGIPFPEPEKTTLAAFRAFLARPGRPTPEFRAGVRVALKQARNELAMLETRLISQPAGDAGEPTDARSARRARAAKQARTPPKRKAM